MMKRSTKHTAQKKSAAKKPLRKATPIIRENNKHHIRFGAVLINDSVERAIVSLAKDGFSHVEFDLLEPSTQLTTWTPKRIEMIRELLQKYELTCSIKTPYTINIADWIPTIQVAQIHYHHHAIRLAAQLQANWISLHLGYYNGQNNWDWFRKKTMEHLQYAMLEIQQWSTLYSIPLVIENMPKLPENGEFFYLMDNLADLKSLYTRIRSTQNRICLDITSAQTNETAAQYIEQLGSSILCIRIRDTAGLMEKDQNGAKKPINWKKCEELLQTTNWGGYIIFETSDYTPLEMHNKLIDYLTITD